MIAVIAIVASSVAGGGSDDSYGSTTRESRDGAATPGTSATPTSGPGPTWTPGPSPTPRGPFASPSSVYGRFVAVLWSAVRLDPTNPSSSALVQQQADRFRVRFGSSVVGLNGNDFRSLRDDTVAVAYLGAFASSRAAADWCIQVGLTTNNSCFGVVLSDSYDYTERGDYIRVYPQ